MSTAQALSAPQGLSMPTAKKIFAFASMCVGMFIALIDIQIVSASLRDIGGGLSAGDDETVWVQTSYLIAEIIIIPLSGWLARVMSTRWLFAASAAGFTLMSLLCGWAWNIQSMIAFRALQGLAGGSMIPLVFTTAFAFFQGKQRVIAAATIGGLAVFSTGLFQVMSIPFYSWLANRVDLRWLLMAGLIGFAVSMYSFVPITHDWGADQLLLPQAFRGLAQQFAVAPTVTLTLGSLPPARLKLASGLFNLMRNLGGAIGIALCGTVLNDRTNLHYSRLADHLNNANLAMSDFVQRSAANFTVQGISPDAAQTAALKNLSALALREARTQAFSDAFYLIMMGFLLAALLVPLMKKPPAH
ncbi:TPA: MFS transporter [Klebsiella quasipneumoniae]|nr:MFS transporter [Klebsiella quasipneumoniae]